LHAARGSAGHLQHGPEEGRMRLAGIITAFGLLAFLAGCGGIPLVPLV
jgi:hypothetical protein